MSDGYGGVYLGTVRAVDDPDDLGRVRLEADQFDDTEEDATWAPVARPLAGSVSSVFFTPKVGDQVVFAFLAGDVRQPIVLGYAHATDRAPQSAEATKHTIRVDDAGSISFDESGVITIEQTGSSSAKITLSGGNVEIEASRLTFNGTPLVLSDFLTTFASHVHSGEPIPASGATGAPLPALVSTLYDTSTT